LRHVETESTEVNKHLTGEERERFRLWLQKQYEIRRQKNPRYSLRAFASILRTDSSSVSQLLSGKRAPSKKALRELCSRLAASPGN
jgi:hypothetical protein